KRSGRGHGARASRSNGNAGCRRSRCAGDRTNSPPLAGNSEPGPPGSNADMNGGANSFKPIAQMLSRKMETASQERSPQDLRVRWLGRMEFARSLGLQEEIVVKKRA